MYTPQNMHMPSMCLSYQNFVTANSLLDIFETFQFPALHRVVSCTSTDVKQEVLYHRFSICCEVNLWRQTQTTFSLKITESRTNQAFIPKFMGTNPAKAVGFFRAKKSSARLPSEGK